MRGMLEDEMTIKKQEQLKALQAENKRLALEKKKREESYRNQQQAQNQFELEATINHNLNNELARMTGYLSTFSYK